MVNIILFDGSWVWFNLNMRIEYLQYFDDKREVQIDGEVYFEVVWNIGRFFIVYILDDEQVEVLGIKFYVEVYLGIKKFEIVLIEGSVCVRVVNFQFIL